MRETFSESKKNLKLELKYLNSVNDRENYNFWQMLRLWKLKNKII